MGSKKFFIHAPGGDIYIQLPPDSFMTTQEWFIRYMNKMMGVNTIIRDEDRKIYDILNNPDTTTEQKVWLLEKLAQTQNP